MNLDEFAKAEHQNFEYEEDVSPLEKNKRKKAVKQMNPETHELIKEFESITCASKEVGGERERRKINAVCINGGGEACGYWWEYAS